MTNILGIGKIGEQPCDICGKAGTDMVFLLHSYYHMVYCVDHTTEEIEKIKAQKKEEFYREREKYFRKHRIREDNNELKEEE